ncbi:hypothetical protein [Fortiea contorta]|uniref:hypothetical protein n=1 Tax=Fortiea contorta TaxID=1892405 RepID=UPI0003496ED9|nr:hypothetical protein [Fortiea contorta]
MDFIKKLIGGILGFLTGLLPKKKKSNGFYLELDEAATGANPKAEAKPAAANGKKAAAPVAAVVADAPVAAPEAVKATKATKAKAAKNGKAPKAEAAKAEPVKTEPVVTAPKKIVETTFAPQYVANTVASSNGRRRPGANMSAFLDLASQVKTPG